MDQLLVATNPAVPLRRRFPAAALLALIFAIYATARVLEIAPSSVPRLTIIALDVVSALCFALVDGTRRYGLRGILVFAAICIVVGNITENLGVATGFPFGHYYFDQLMGPRLFHVPILLGLAYIGMAYVSWTLGCILAGNHPTASFVAVPLLASFLMVAWDLAQDPVWSTALRGWIWRDGGPWFGVPVSNYLGWFATNFAISLLFALACRRGIVAEREPQRLHGRAAILFYALCAACNVAQVLGPAGATTVADPTGRIWRVGDITAASALVSIFVMGTLAAFAWIRTTVVDRKLRREQGVLTP
jgi:uncharacterized membrane protein